MGLLDAGLSALTTKNQNIFVDLIKESKLQLTNYFDFFIYRRLDTTNALSAIKSGLSMGIDAAIAKLYSRSIQLPSSRAISYNHIDCISFAENLDDLGEINIDFFDIEAGAVLRYLSDWRDEIFTIQEFETGINQVVWNSNQEQSKRDADLYLKAKDGSFLQTYPAIKIKGLKLSEFSLPEINHTDSDILTISATFVADDIIYNTSLINI